MRMLMAARDVQSARRIEELLQPQGFNVFVTDLGEELVHLNRKFDYDLILLNAFLEDMTGWQALKELREAKVELPVLVMDEPAGIEDVCRGFGFRGVHCLVEPFEVEELVSSIRDILPGSEALAPSVVTIGKLRIDLIARTVEVDGNRVRLQAREYQLLELLARRAGEPVGTRELIAHTYGDAEECPIGMMHVFMSLLRKKLHAATRGDTYIRVVWGKGYCLEASGPAAGEPA